MEVQAALRSDIALVFDECTPFHVDRDYTARSTERTHRWLERCLRWHAEHGPGRPGSSTGSSRAASTRTCARLGARRSPRSALRRDRDRRLARRGQGADVRGRRRGRPPSSSGVAPRPAAPPARDRRDRRPDRAASSSGSTRSTARCRRASAATASRSCPTPGPLAPRPRQGALARVRRAAPRGLPVPGLRARLHARLPALPAPRRASSPALRLLTLHNLALRRAADGATCEPRSTRARCGGRGRRAAGGRRAPGATSCTC